MESYAALLRTSTLSAGGPVAAGFPVGVGYHAWTMNVGGAGAEQDNDSSPRRFSLRLAGGALLLGLLLRLLFVFRYAHLAGDTLVYGNLARNLVTQGVYGLSHAVDGRMSVPHPTLIRLPGYPLFLALFFRVFGNEHYLPVLLGQVLLDLAGCWLAASTAGRIFGQKAFTPTLWLAALCPFTANYTAAALTETPTLFTVQLTFYLLVRWRQQGAGFDRWLVALGAAMASSILLRPEQGLLAAAVVPAVFWAGRPAGAARALRLALAAALVTVLPLIFWTVRNERTMHTFEPLAPRTATDPGEPNPYGFQRWYRTWGIDFASTVTTYWPFDGEAIDVADLPDRAFDSNEQFNRTAELFTDYNVGQAVDPALDARFNALAAERIKANPFRYYVALPVARLLNMTLRPRVEMLPVPLRWWRAADAPRAGLFAMLMASINFAYLLCALVGWMRARVFTDFKEWKPVLIAMVATIFLRGALLLTVDNSEPRYTLEFYPVLFVLAAATFSRDQTRILTSRRLQPSSEVRKA